MSVSWDIVCSIVTATAAIIALGVSVVQMRTSNKQQLLDRRLRLWIKAQGLIRLCDNSRKLLEKRENGPEFANDFVFQLLTNNSLMCDVGPAVGHVLEQDWQSRLLTKLEGLREMAFEIELVFKGHPAKTLGTFVEEYATLLLSMYQYQITLKSLHETSEHFKYDLEKAISAVGEEERRIELYKARDDLLKALNRLDARMVEQVVAQCKLSRLS